MLAVSIDDSLQNLMLVEAYCDELGLKVKSFENPKEGLEYLLDDNNNIHIVFIDYMMPELNGIEVIETFRGKKPHTPIIMITAASGDFDLKMEALTKGATDFLTKPLNAAEFIVRTTNLLDLKIAQDKLEDKAKWLEEEVMKATIELMAREHEALRVLGKTAEYKDPETSNHIARVAYYSRMLAREYGLSTDMQDIIFYASPFHDIGKVGIPDAILLKPGRLAKEEFEVMKKHSSIGHGILDHSSSQYLNEGATIALTHHEKYDGNGYPNGLVGEDIPISGRITAVADVFDALTSKRPYKEPWSFDKAKQLLIDESGKHFDPKIVELFMENIDEVKQIYTQFSEEEDTLEGII
jgi:putative two-component system response regulator